MRHRVDFPTGWKNQDAETPVDGWIPPPTGCFARWKAHFREDPSTDWMFSDSGMLTNGKIPPLTGGIRTLENLADSTDAEYEEDRPEKQFLRKLQWMWE